ncbi:MAG: ATP-binding protein [Clostridia bacterium]|nr:ATP-binding protein [Clostridia bacterium]MBQ6883973.1 ATP-binding protein [Clostridia bacterium]
MLKRKVYDELLKWKKERKSGLKKCLMIKGARQVGKSYIVKAFGEAEYKSYIPIDFHKQPKMKEIFTGELTPDEIYKRMTAYIPNIQLIAGDTLIFLDEIQYCANARTAIKFLAEDMRYDVISSGSLLGLSYSDDDDGLVEAPASIPVGYERQITMYSLDFEEFLWAYGYGAEAIDYLKEYFESDKQIPESIHDKYESLFREYMVVGGMPEVVADFAKHKDFNRVANIQADILAEYQDDISKHAKGREKQYVRMCYDAVPKQLAKEIKKFQYSTVEKGQTRRKFGGSIKWLKDANLVNTSYNVHEPFIPLLANANEDQFKLYINDTGLLTCVYGFDTKLAILNNTIKGNAKGGIYENVIAECLVKKGYTLYYYKPDDTHELEFVVEKNAEVIPVEVKAGNTASVSLNSFIDKFSPSVAYKLIGGRNGKVGVKITLPHYMVMFL